MNFYLKNTSISTKIFIGFALVLLVLITTIIVSYNNSNKIINSANLIIHTQEVLTELKDIETKLINLETGQRGFIITGELQYLEPYSTSLRIIENKVASLKKLTSDNQSQTKRIDLLEELIDRKLKELDNTLVLRQQEGFEAAKEIVSAGGGKKIMDEIRAQIEEIRDEELRLMKIRSVGPSEAKEVTNIILGGLLILSIIISMGIAVLTSLSISIPIKKLHTGTIIVGQGNLDHKLGINRNDEIGQLSKSFDSMLVKLKTTLASKYELEKEIETRKNAEEKLLKAKISLEKSEAQLIESNKTKDKFFSIIAHDLRSPFDSMIGFSNMLNENFDEFTKEEQKEYHRIIHTNIESTFKLLKNLLIWSEAERGTIEFKPENENLFLISKAVIDLIKLTADSKSINIKTEIPQHILLTVDKNMLSTIIRNLLTNAIKFTPDRGEITIAAELQKDEGNNTFVEIRVKDNGVGISMDIQSKLFDIGESISTAGTSDEKGTGLGLNICKEFVEKHEGRIWVKSEVGKGSTFYFTLPNASYFAT